jgi:nucleotide-binding universal stress UspA family protein
MYKNILVAYDGDPSSSVALDHALGLSRALDARLTVLAVVPPLPAPAYEAAYNPVELEADANEEAHGALRDAVARGGRFPVHPKMRSGHPAKEIGGRRTMASATS